MSGKQIFPKNFFWGVSTSAHQIEGGQRNQWTAWEQTHAKRLAKTAPQRLGWLPRWDSIQQQATDPSTYVSGNGTDHYHRYSEDFAIARSLKCNALRFGIEWSRLEPQEGEWNEEAVAHYREYIQELRRKGMEPFLNIWHWTVPIWFEKKGGFKKRANLRYFERFVQKIADEYGADLTYILTLNEPNVYSTHSFLMGWWPPQERSMWTAVRVYANLVSAHRRAYHLLKKQYPHLQIGIATQLGNIQAKRPHSWVDEAVTKIMRYAWNWWFLHRINRTQDFVGFNYYFTDYYRNFKRANPTVPLNDMGWYMEPEGIYPLLVRTWTRFKKPLFITENGLADMHDEYRRWWLEETMIAMERAMSEGVDLRGYFHWSLLDNFEWAEGWWPKFGLVAVDREHDMKRTVRPSAHWYAEHIRRFQ